MIIGKRKSLEEIFSFLEGIKKVLFLSCQGCAAFYHFGGKRDVEAFVNQPKFLDYLEKQKISYKILTLSRVCDREIVKKKKIEFKEFEGIISFSCGIGVQVLSEILPQKKIFPGVDTLFAGRKREENLEKLCELCGDCKVHFFEGFCPVSLCPKGILNGPCGGMREDGTCEVEPTLPCVWNLIYQKLINSNKKEEFLKIFPPKNYLKPVSIKSQF